MTTIYLVRHAEVKNPKRIIYGRLGFFKLSERGKEQARVLSKYFQNKGIEAIYTSPLLRARQTAKIISAGKIPIKISKNLTETNFTKWEGKPYAHRSKADMEIYLNRPTRLRVGETLQQVVKRMTKEINLIAKRHVGKKIIVISHADPIICSRLTYENKDLDLATKTRVQKASITSLEFNSELQCTKTNYLEIVESEEEIR